MTDATVFAVPVFVDVTAVSAVSASPNTRYRPSAPPVRA